MNPTESIRLTRAELDTVLTACSYSLAMKTLDYNQSKLISVSLGRIPASVAKAAKIESQNDENPGEDGTQDQGTYTRESLATALNKYHDNSKAILESFPKMQIIGIGIQSKVITAAKSPTGTANLSFSSEECAFLTQALRTFEEAEIEPTKKAEMVLAFITLDYDGESFVAESASQSKDERESVQSRNDDFTCLMAKVITYGKSLASVATAGAGTANDQ